MGSGLVGLNGLPLGGGDSGVLGSVGVVVGDGGVLSEDAVSRVGGGSGGGSGVDMLGLVRDSLGVGGGDFGVLMRALPGVLGELEARSKRNLYRSDFDAWCWDVLGLRTYEKLRGAMGAALFGEKRKTAIKSSNGVAKSFQGALAVMWNAMVFEPGERLCLVSAPTLDQIEQVVFRYLKQFYDLATQRGVRPFGEINEQLEWNYRIPSSGNKGLLVKGKRPSDRDIVSSFQGIRSMDGSTFVLIDEGGGVPDALFVAADAVMTGGESRLLTLGNPDHQGTYFHRVFVEDKFASTWNRFTISAFDTPNFTGERVYPETPEGDVLEGRMNDNLVQPSWVEARRLEWGEGSNWWRSKVLGEFPERAGDAFFSVDLVDFAMSDECVVEGWEDVRPVLGVDVARHGDDATVVYENRGGRVRFVDSWNDSDLMSTARRVHAIALERGAVEVRVDGTGVGAGVFDNLNDASIVPNRPYDLFAPEASGSAPDRKQYAQARSWWYGQFRDLLVRGGLDLCGDDKVLRDELLQQTYDFNSSGAIQLTGKKEMRRAGIKSPDHLDAAILSVIDLGYVRDIPVSRVESADVFLGGDERYSGGGVLAGFYDYSW